MSSILSTPIIAVFYFLFYLADFFIYGISHSLLKIFVGMAFFVPILVFLPPLLVFYLCGGLQRGAISKIFLCTATVACLISQGLWFHYFFQGS